MKAPQGEIGGGSLPVRAGEAGWCAASFWKSRQTAARGILSIQTFGKSFLSAPPGRVPFLCQTRKEPKKLA